MSIKGADSRLNENEAVEELKQLAIQLQRLYDRIPQRGPSTNVILTLLDICRSTTTSSNANNQLMLKPPAQPSIETKTLSIYNGSTFVDKETNTSFDNLVWHQHNGSGCHVMISDKCDNNNQLPKSSSVHKNKSCNANNDPMNCSTNSINFDNLQLQCMCSSDNNSIDEYQLENCDNCSANNPQKVLIKQQQQQQQQHQCSFINKTGDDEPINSFRERLLNCTNNSNFSKIDNISVLRTNSLTKRNSELVLGTNFDNNQSTLGGFNNKTNHRTKNRISKTFDSCDNIYTQKQTLDGGNCSRSKMNDTNKSEYSLATEVNIQQNEQFPYSLLERPIMKLSQSEDRNLRELKIALSSTLPEANNTNQTQQQKQYYQQQQQQQHLRTIGSSKLSQTINSQSHSCTSSSSSSKIDKISLSMSISSTSDVQAKRLQHQQSINNNEIDIMTDDSPKQQPISIPVDYKCCQNDTEQLEKTTMNVKSNQKSTTTTSSTTNINNSTTNNNNTNGKKRKSPDGKLTIDLNHRSNEEVSV